MTRRSLGILSLVLFMAAGAVWIRTRPTTPVIAAHPLAVVKPTSTTAAPTTTTPPPPPPAAPAVARDPGPPPPPPPPATPALTGPFWVASAAVTVIHVHSSPDGPQTETLSNVTEAGTTRVLLVKSRPNPAWIEAYLPSRPNQHTGFVSTSEVTLSTVDTQIKVERAYHRLTAWAGDQMIAQVPVAVGKPSTPTPSGIYYLAMLFKSPNPGGAYGPYVFGLSAHSDVFESFGGGDGMVGLHGTNEPASVGRSASHGCLRVSNATIAKLVSQLPVGTPIVIV